MVFRPQAGKGIKPLVQTYYADLLNVGRIGSHQHVGRVAHRAGGGDEVIAPTAEPQFIQPPTKLDCLWRKSFHNPDILAFSRGHM